MYNHFFCCQWVTICGYNCLNTNQYLNSPIGLIAQLVRELARHREVIAREIKHRIYRKREREKYHAIMGFPPFFTFAVFNAKRAVLAFVNNASNFFWSFWLVLLQLATCVYAQWCSTQTDRLTVIVYTKRKKKCEKASLRLSTVLWKSAQIMQLRQNIPRKPHSTGN